MQILINLRCFAERRNANLPFLKNFAWILVWFFFFFSSFPVYGQGGCALFCNDLVHVSIGPDGYSVINPDQVLERDSVQCPGRKYVDVFVAGSSIGDTVRCVLVGQILDVEVRDSATNNRCSSRIKVEDKSGPLIQCQDTVVLCGINPDSAGLPAFLDNCDPNPSVWYTDVVQDLTCSGGPYNAIITRTWNGRDNKNNLAFPCVQQILFKTASLSDVVFPPNRDGMQAPVIDCSTDISDTALTGVPMIDSVGIGSFCKFLVRHVDTYLPICENSFKVHRKWTVLDCCTGRDTSAYQVIKVMDQTPPVITCDSVIRARTNNDACASSFFLPRARVSDDCSSNISVRVIYPGGVLNSNGGLIMGLPVGTHTVTYVATDDCGNDTTCVARVEVVDDDPPAPVCVEYLGVSINSTGMGCIPAKSFDAGSTDNCCLDSIRVKRMGEPDSQFDDKVCFFCEDVGQSIMVIVRFYDCHGNFNECMTEVLPQDKIRPTIVCPPDTSLLCTQDFRETSLTGVATATDNCDSLFFSFSDDTSGLTMCGTGMVLRTWRVEDLSGLQDSCIQKITMLDTTATRFFPPGDTMLQCPVDFNNLPVDSVGVISDCEMWGLSVTDTVFTGDMCQIKIFRTYRFREWCSGMDTAFVQTISIVDTMPPVWIQAPGSLDTFFHCSQAVNFPVPLAVDSCIGGTLVRQVSFDSIPGTCPNDYRLTAGFVAEDQCLNRSDTFLVVVTVRDTIPPGFMNVPQDTVIACDASIPENNVIGFDNCDGSLQVTSFEVKTPVCPQSSLCVLNFVATDQCNNSDTIQWEILVVDTVAPTANPIPDSSYACPEDVPDPSIAVVTGLLDNCSDSDDITVTFISDSFQNRCDDTLVRVYRLEDECGNTRDVEQYYFILDVIPPRVNSCPGTLTDTIVTAPNVCEDTVFLMASYMDNCPNTIVTVTNDSPFAFSNNGNSATGIYPLGYHEFRFYGEDECGNRDSMCVVRLTVLELDTPTLQCVADTIFLDLDSTGSVVVLADTVLAAPASDNCSTVDVQVVPDFFNCDSLLAGAVKEVFVFASDTFGNVGTCGPVTIVLRDPLGICNSPLAPPGNLAGKIMTSRGSILENAEIRLNGSHSAMRYSNNSGGYLFTGLQAGMDVEIVPYKNDDPLNGLSTLDIIQIADHILGRKSFQQPYQFIAADVNRSGTVTIRDVVEIRKLILGHQTSFTNNTSWRFVDAHYHFQNLQTPLAEIFPETIRMPNLAHSYYDLDFTAIKVGDLNLDAQLHYNQKDISDRNQPDPVFVEIPEIVFDQGMALEVVWTVPQVNALRGFQATLGMDFEKLSLEGMESFSTGMTEENFCFEGLLEGKILLSWNGDELPGRPLFKLRFTANQPGRLSESISIRQDGPLASEAYDQDLLAHPMAFKFLKNPLGESRMPIRIIACEPNPFSEFTRIRYDLAEAMPVQIEIRDLSGKLFFSEKEKREAGSHTLLVEGSRFSSSGVYVLTLASPHGIVSEKLVYLD